jgi:outer membrane receptor protein involved in Fe transport
MHIFFKRQKYQLTWKQIMLTILMFNGFMPFSNAAESLYGIVTDKETGIALNGVNIHMDGIAIGASTDALGRFTLSLENQQHKTLTISHLGYKDVIIELTGQALPLVIQMEPIAEMLGAVVVTATRSRRNSFEVPVRMNVIDEADIKTIPAFSADDYLHAIPGISIRRGASFLGTSTVSLRGMGPEAGRTLVLLDGVPLNKADGGSVNWNAINTSQIGQIEVLKGPGSTISGGNAMGGIIHIISPRPKKKLQGYISQQIGNMNTFRTSTGVSGTQNAFFWGLNGMYRESDGYVTAFADDIDEYTIPSFLNEYQFGANAGYFLNPDHVIELAGNMYEGKRGTGASFYGYGFANEDVAARKGAYNNYQSWHGRMVYRGTLNNNNRIHFTAYGQRENYQRIRESLRNQIISRYDVESIRDDAGFTSSYSLQAGSGHLVTVGADMRYGSVDGADIYLTSTDKVFNKGSMNQTGIYILDEISFGTAPLTIMTGLRYDHASFYRGNFSIETPTGETAFLHDFTGDIEDASWGALSPRLSLQFHKTGQYRIYAGYSRGFRAPALDDMCRTGRISGGMQRGNPFLKPEYLDNAEAGGDLFIGERFKLSASAFYSRGSDYHAYIATGDSVVLNNRLRPIRKKDNMSKAEIQGIELQSIIQVIKGLSLNVNYTYIQTNILEYKTLNKDTDTDLTGKELVYQPKGSFYSAINWNNNIANMHFSFHNKSSQWLNDVNTEKIEAFNYFDLHLWRDLYKGLSASVMVHNLFNQDFTDSSNMVAPGRIISLEVKYSF